MVIEWSSYVGCTVPVLGISIIGYCTVHRAFCRDTTTKSVQYLIDNRTIVPWVLYCTGTGEPRFHLYVSLSDSDFGSSAMPDSAPSLGHGHQPITGNYHSLERHGTVPPLVPLL